MFFTPPVIFMLEGYCRYLYCLSVHRSICLPIHPSKYCLGQYLETIHDCSSYFQIRSIWHEICALPGYFELLTFSLENMTFTLNVLFRPLWQLLHIFRAHQPAMGPVHWSVILTFCPLTGTWPLIYIENISPIAQKL